MDIIKLAFYLILVLILLFVGYQIINIANTQLSQETVPEKEEELTALSKLGKLFSYKQIYKFNIKDYVAPSSELVSSKDYFNENNFCKKLKHAINQSIIDNSFYQIDKEYIKFDTSYFPFEEVYRLISECKPEILKEYSGKIQTDVCYFDMSGSFAEVLYDYKDEFKTNEPLIHNCFFPYNYETDVSYKVIKIHDTTIKGNLADKGKYGYLIKTFVNATVDEDNNCLFKLFVCAQPLISDTEDSKLISIFEWFKNANDITGSLKTYFTGIDPTLAIPYQHKTGNLYPRTIIYDFNDDEYRPGLWEISNAIYAGLWEWNKANYKTHNKLFNTTVDFYQFNPEDINKCYDQDKLTTPLGLTIYCNNKNKLDNHDYDKLVITRKYRYTTLPYFKGFIYPIIFICVQ
ncbi:MAG: hypothetical protein J7K26_03365 [Candidatus Aenigmarchaeota archaeon]|nr:hypothetical protein [Candidatus Aenigmarchaeota archaeon]